MQKMHCFFLYSVLHELMCVSLKLEERTLFSFRLELNLVFYFIPDSRTNARNDALDRPTPNVMHTSCLNVQLGNKHLFFYMYPSWSFVGHFTRVIEDWTPRIGQTLFRVLYLLAQKKNLYISVCKFSC